VSAGNSVDNPTVATAASILRSGGLVAFPTETVYGLGADATNADAVRKIFAAKGRPSTNPLIAHVSDADIARRYCTSWPETASKLAAAFWPGPLTLVLPKVPAIVTDVSAGLGTVGLRVPNHPLALELLRAFNGPVAAPSANRSNHVSPTRAEHVREELGDSVDLILDGGPCAVGIESTVLDLASDRPRILRLGGASREAIESVIGPVDVFAGAVGHGTAAASPGQLALHYAPRARAIRFTTIERATVLSWWRARLQDRGAVVFFGGGPDLFMHVPIRRRVEMPRDPDEYARQLYAVLRDVDRAGVETILVELPPDEPPWAAVRDRLTRATKAWPDGAQ
jgi:L-threonylcarbamoyladenylate synthase